MNSHYIGRAAASGRTFADQPTARRTHIRCRSIGGRRRKAHVEATDGRIAVALPPGVVVAFTPQEASGLRAALRSAAITASQQLGGYLVAGPDHRVSCHDQLGRQCVARVFARDRRVLFVAPHSGGATFAPLKIGALLGDLAGAIDTVLGSMRPAATAGSGAAESRTA